MTNYVQDRKDVIRRHGAEATESRRNSARRAAQARWAKAKEKERKERG